METTNQTNPPVSPIPPTPPAPVDDQAKKNHVSTGLGFLIVIVIVAAIVVLVWKYMDIKQEAITVAPDALVTTIPQAPVTQPANDQIPVEGMPADIGVGLTNPVSGSTKPTETTGINIDYEIQQLDSQVKPVNADDFSDAEMSDTKVGL